MQARPLGYYGRIKPSPIRIPQGARSAALGAAIILDQQLAASVIQRWNGANQGKNEALAVLTNFPYDTAPVGSYSQLDGAVTNFETLNGSAGIVSLVGKATLVLQNNAPSFTSQEELQALNALENMGHLLQKAAQALMSIPPPTPAQPPQGILLSAAEANGYNAAVQSLLEAIGLLGTPAILVPHKAALQALSGNLQTSPVYVPPNFASTIQAASDAVTTERNRQAALAQTGQTPVAGDQTALYVGGGVALTALLLIAFA